MECKFHVGQKVVCVDGVWKCAMDPSGNRAPTPGRVPVANEVLEITRIEEHFGVPLLGFAEILNLWDHRCFRPVVERKTDISIFKAMLTPKTEQVPA